LVRPIIILLGAIPILAALFIVVPTLLRPEIPNVAVNPDDVISIEYSKQHLKKISFGVSQSIGAETTQVLSISNDGQAVYGLTKDGYSEPDKKYQISKAEMTKITGLIKETGFMQIPQTSFQVKNDLDEYDKFGIQVTLNGKSVKIQWPDQNSTQEFIPPLISQVQDSMDAVIAEIIK
jgi:hypothetical protein